MEAPISLLCVSMVKGFSKSVMVMAADQQTGISSRMAAKMMRQPPTITTLAFDESFFRQPMHLAPMKETMKPMKAKMREMMTRARAACRSLDSLITDSFSLHCICPVLCITQFIHRPSHTIWPVTMLAPMKEVTLHMGIPHVTATPTKPMKLMIWPATSLPILPMLKRLCPRQEGDVLQVRFPFEVTQLSHLLFVRKCAGGGLSCCQGSSSGQTRFLLIDLKEWRSLFKRCLVFVLGKRTFICRFLSGWSYWLELQPLCDLKGPETSSGCKRWRMVKLYLVVLFTNRQFNVRAVVRQFSTMLNSDTQLMSSWDDFFLLWSLCQYLILV